MENKPGKPWAYDLRSNQVDLAWNKARTVEDSEVYQVFYKSLREDKGWKTSRNETKAASMLVDSLTPDTAYIFQIRIMDKYSQTYTSSSDVSETIKTYPSSASAMKEKSNLITKGPPAIYQLPLTEIDEARDEKTKIRKMRVGKGKCK